MKTTEVIGDTIFYEQDIAVNNDGNAVAELLNADGDGPGKKPEVEPDNLPEENPGVVPETKPNRDNDEGADDDDDDDDDEDDDDPFTETEIGDDPDEIRTKTTIM